MLIPLDSTWLTLVPLDWHWFHLMTLDLTFHMLAMNDNCIQNSWLLIAKDFLIIFSLFLIFSHFLSLFIIFYHFKTFFTTLVVIIYIFKILAKLILANLGTKIDVPIWHTLVNHFLFMFCMVWFEAKSAKSYNICHVPSSWWTKKMSNVLVRIFSSIGEPIGLMNAFCQTSFYIANWWMHLFNPWCRSKRYFAKTILLPASFT